MSASTQQSGMTESEVERVENAIKTITGRLKAVQEFLRGPAQNQQVPESTRKLMNDCNFDAATETISNFQGLVEGIHKQQKEV